MKYQDNSVYQYQNCRLSIEKYIVYCQIKTQPVMKIHFHLCQDKEMLDINLIALVNFVTFYLFDYCGEKHVLFG